MIDESTYGFSKSDAEQLVGLISMADVEFEELKPLGKAASLELEFQVINGVTLQYRINGGSWTTILTLAQQVSGTSIQHTINPTPDYQTWHTATNCPTPP